MRVTLSVKDGGLAIKAESGPNGSVVYTEETTAESVTERHLKNEGRCDPVVGTAVNGIATTARWLGIVAILIIIIKSIWHEKKKT